MITIVGCKSTEQSFKDEITLRYEGKNICFKIDQSKKVATFGTLLFENKEYESSNIDSFNDDFESGEDCDLVALTGKVNDSIYISIIYPYKKDIEQTLDEYQKWYYKGKVYYYKSLRNGSSIDTISIQTNPPIDNPRNVEDW